MISVGSVNRIEEVSERPPWCPVAAPQWTLDQDANDSASLLVRSNSVRFGADRGHRLQSPSASSWRPRSWPPSLT